MNKKIYGIDLGTTNSLIGCDGHLITRLVPSKVDMNRRVSVPHSSIGEGIVGSYKVNMGLGPESKISVEASTIVLEELCRHVKEYNNEKVEDVIISVPAYFSFNQRQAVRQAAENAGLNLISVINEPTAAAIHICGGYSEDIKRGVFAVYDLGGGTFDCTLIDSRSGKYKVIATDGCILGGDNLDKAIANFIMDQQKVLHENRGKLEVNKLVATCEVCKRKIVEACSYFEPDSYTVEVALPESMCRGGNKVGILSIEDYKRLVREVFGETVGILSNLIEANISKGTDVNVVFVGGSVHDTYLCRYVLKQCGIPGTNVHFDDNPDFTVALGVVEYAHAMSKGEADVVFRDVTKQLSIKDEAGKAEVIIEANSSIPCSKTKIFTNHEESKYLNVDLYQGNSSLASDNEFIGTLQYPYGTTMGPNEGDVEVTVSVDSSGFITLEVEDIVNFGEKQSLQLKGF